MRNSNHPTDEMLFEAKAAYARNGKNKVKAAAELSLPYSTFNNRLNTAARLGLMDTEPVMPGFKIAETSAQYDGDGNLQSQSIKQRLEGEQFEMPPGHFIKGVSSLLDASGEIKNQWIKTARDNSTEAVVNALKTAFTEYEGHATLADAPKYTSNELATFYPIIDHHYGMYAWAEECGADYDQKIARDILCNTMSALVGLSPPSEEAVILNIGDFFHSDTDENRTRRGGHPLDVDTRYAMVLSTGVDLLIHCCQMALQKHARVTVRCLRGNHDPYAALALAIALKAFFTNQPRITVDTDPSPLFTWEFGKVLIGATHGDLIKHELMPGVLAARCAEAWGRTEFRYIYLGHVHHKSKGGNEQAGAIWETFQTLAPRDAWATGQGYSAARSMCAITHHKDRGEIIRNTVAVRGPT